MNDTPLISVILPVFNVESYLGRCFDSLKQQTYKNIEILFVDDGSTDQSGKICEEFMKQDARVTVYHKENGGLSDARNYGIEKARGSHVVFVDSDDYIDSDYVEYLYQLLVRNHTKMSICQHRVCYQSGLIKDFRYDGNREKLLSQECLEKLLYNENIDTSAYAKLFDIRMFQDIRFPIGHIFEDLATIYKLIGSCEFIACGGESKYNYVYHDNSISNRSFNKNYFEYTDITDQMVEAIVNEYPDMRDAGIIKMVRSRFSLLNLMINTDFDLQNKELIEKYKDYIMENRKIVLRNPRVPYQNKAAILLISFNYRLYRYFWKKHRKHIMGR